MGSFRSTQGALPPRSRTSLELLSRPQGTEVDLLLEASQRLLAVEIKSGQTLASDFFTSLETFRELAAASVESMLVYGGSSSQTRSNAQVLAWSDIQQFDWTLGEGALPGRAKTRRTSSSKSSARKPKPTGRLPKSGN